MQQTRLSRLSLWPTRIINDGEPAAPLALQDDLFPKSDRPCYSYALIDANRLFGLTQVLENSGLRYRCLFKGSSAQKFADSAPYLVELLPQHPFTRRLFTQRPVESGPWADQAVSFVVSPLSLAGLQSHLRLFTQFRDRESGRTVFFRFFAPEVMRTVIPALPAPQLGKFTRGISCFICPDDGQGAVVLKTAPPPGTAVTSSHIPATAQEVG